MFTKITLKQTRFWLFTALVVLAPLSKYPSFALPAFNFSSFRLGLYQILAVVFIAVCVVPMLKARKTVFVPKLALICLKVLAIVAVIGLVTAINRPRSALLVASVLVLVALVVSAWWYVATELHKKQFQLLIKSILWAGVVFGLVAIVQFIASTFTSDSFGILCKNCTSAVFGFPRVNGFAAEPQFLANALIPFLFVSFGVFYKTKARLGAIALLLTSLAIGLTFSRGAFAAIAVGVVTLIALLYYSKILSLKPFAQTLGLLVIGIGLSFVLLVGSASYRYNDTPNITYNTVRSMLQHVSLGVINLPDKQIIVTTVQGDDFVSPGLIEASTNERLGAAELAIQAWQFSPKTLAIGTGAGNLGPFVVANIDQNAPNNLTVYIYYILVLAELGLVGLLALAIFYLSTIWALARLLRKQNGLVYAVICTILISFLAQYWFFGSYINVVYVWLWFGIGLGALQLTPKRIGNFGYNESTDS